MMKNWRRLANYSLVDNTTLQAWFNRVSHNVMTWFAFPGMMAGLLLWAGAWLLGGMSHNALVGSIFGGVGLIFMAVVGYSYYVPKGYRKYFYVVFAAPAALGLFLSVACIAVAMFSGIPASPPH